MNKKLKLLDLFCCAGGCAKGYQRAGFWVRGVDIKAQPRYCGEEFIQGDALEYLRGLIASGEIHEFDAIHASPPCQAFTLAQRIQNKAHDDLVAPVRDLLKLSNLPYVIENVPGAPLIDPVRINGQLFGLKVDRERWFETSFTMPFFLIPSARRAVKMGRRVKDGDVIQVVGHFSNVEYAKRAMDIDWMVRDELREAIPPAYTEFIGKHLAAFIQSQSEVAV